MLGTGLGVKFTVCDCVVVACRRRTIVSHSWKTLQNLRRLHLSRPSLLFQNEMYR